MASILFEDLNGLGVTTEMCTYELVGQGPVIQPIYKVYYTDNEGIRLEDSPLVIDFQVGSPQLHGANGLTNEAMIAILLHRLDIQNKRFSCSENIRVLDALHEAKAALDEREARMRAEREASAHSKDKGAIK